LTFIAESLLTRSALPRSFPKRNPHAGIVEVTNIFP
jgi:hypothetical protein